MLRLVLWMFLLYVIWKLLRSFFFHFNSLGSRFGNQESANQSAPPFPHVQDAEFEDVTGKSEPDSKEQERPK